MLFTAITDGTHAYMLTLSKASSASVAYFIAFHLTFTCFFLNLFLGVLTASFEKHSGTALMTIGEKKWIASRKMLINFRPGAVNDEEESRPHVTATCCKRAQPIFWFKCRSVMFALAVNPKLEALWRNVIVANTVILASEMYPMSERHSKTVHDANLVFLCLYTAECVIKLLGFGAKKYFSDFWLIGDFTLVALSITMRVTGGVGGIESLRVMRVLRIIVLASKIPSLVALIDVVVQCLKASFAVM